MSELRANESPWRSAILAATAFALDPLGAGIVVRSGPGPARDAWLTHLRAALAAGAPLKRISAAIADDRLLGGLDIAATLKAGRPIAEMGVLAGADGGVLVLAMAERASPDLAARLAAVLDTGVVALERDGFALQIPTRIGLVALDEGYGDERPAAAMLERCGYAVDLGAIGMRDIEPPDLCAADFDAARARLNAVAADPALAEAIVVAAAELGVASLRAPLFALRAARALCALEGRTIVEDRDVALAASLTLAPRATQIPAEGEDAGADGDKTDPEVQAEAGPDDNDLHPGQASERLEDLILAAAKAAIPAGLLERIAARRSDRSKSAGEGTAGAARRTRFGRTP